MKRESYLRETESLTRASCEFFVADSFRASRLVAAAAHMGGLRAGGVRAGEETRFWGCGPEGASLDSRRRAIDGREGTITG